MSVLTLQISAAGTHLRPVFIAEPFADVPVYIAVEPAAAIGQRNHLLKIRRANCAGFVFVNPSVVELDFDHFAVVIIRYNARVSAKVIVCLHVVPFCIRLDLDFRFYTMLVRAILPNWFRVAFFLLGIYQRALSWSISRTVSQVMRRPGMRDFCCSTSRSSSFCAGRK